MAILGAAPWKEKWLELGVQTLNDATLRRINRGHDAAASAKAIELAEKTDVQVCAAVLAFPVKPRTTCTPPSAASTTCPSTGSSCTTSMYFAGTRRSSRAYRAGEYVPLTEDAYVELAVDALTELANIIVHQVGARSRPRRTRRPPTGLPARETSYGSSNTPIIGDVERA